MSTSAYTRRTFLKTAGLAAGLALSGGAGAWWGKQSKRPNFVFILIDDMGWTDAGCYGSTFYETPSIDRLAAEGVRFTSAYAACPVCSPTRASIMTGKYPARLQLTQWLNAKTVKKKLIDAPWTPQMPLEEVTMGEAFKQAGYSTFFVGKWHLGARAYYPDKQGFDRNIAGNSMGSTKSYFSPYNMENLEDGSAGECLNDRLTDEAIKLIETHKDGPFLLYLSHYAVHTPLQTKKELQAKYEAKAAGLPPAEGPRLLPEGDCEALQVQDHAVYAGMVQSMDESVGRVLDKLAALGIDDRTVVIFMSDNGGLSTIPGAPTSNVPLRAGKGWLYEGGIREPMIIKWPGVTKPGSVYHEPVISTDFYPTMLEMAGLPPRPGQHKDGVSLAPLLSGTGKPRRKGLFWHYPHYSPQGGHPCGAIRVSNYKLIEFYEDNHAELYCLKDDIGERNDLAAAKPGVTRRLRAMLRDWRASVHATMPTPNPEWKPPEPKSS